MKKVIRFFFACSKKQGTSLIECIVYCAALLFLTSISFSWLLKIHATIRAQDKTQSVFMSNILARDIVTRTIRQAPSNKKLWKKIDEREIVWRHNNHDNGLSYEKGRIIFSEGIFSEVQQQWQTRTKSLICDDIKKLAIHLQTKEKFGEHWIIKVFVNCDSSYWPIALMNGVIA